MSEKLTLEEANKYMAMHTEVKDMDFSKLEFKSQNFDEITFVGCNFSDAILKNCDVKYSKFEGCKFIDAKLIDSEFEDTNFINNLFRRTTITNCDFGEGVFTDNTWMSAKCSGNNLAFILAPYFTYAELGVMIFNFGKDFAYFDPKSKMLGIGCEFHTVDHWLKEYESIGRYQHYSSADIKRYGSFIQMCKDYEE